MDIHTIQQELLRLSIQGDRILRMIYDSRIPSEPGLPPTPGSTRIPTMGS